MAGQPADGRGNPIPALCPVPGLAQRITIAGSSAHNTNAFDKNTKVIEIFATSACYYKLGTDSSGAATTSDNYLPAGVTRSYSIAPGGDVHYDFIAAIQSAAGGTLFISELQ